jgi:two-component system chemotaxis response regulator CheV
MNTLLFLLGSQEIFGIPAGIIQETLKSPKFTEVQSDQPGLKGMVSIRGEIMPIFSLEETMGFLTQNTCEHMIVLRKDEGRRLGAAAFHVTALLRNIEITEDMLLTANLQSMRLQKAITGVALLPDGKIVTLINVDLASVTQNTLNARHEAVITA